MWASVIVCNTVTRWEVLPETQKELELCYFHTPARMARQKLILTVQICNKQLDRSYHLLTSNTSLILVMFPLYWKPEWWFWYGNEFKREIGLKWTWDTHRHEEVYKKLHLFREAPRIRNFTITNFTQNCHLHREKEQLPPLPPNVSSDKMLYRWKKKQKNYINWNQRKKKRARYLWIHI